VGWERIAAAGVQVNWIRKTEDAWVGWLLLRTLRRRRREPRLRSGRRALHFFMVAGRCTFYVPCDNDDESQGFVPGALHFFRVRGRQDDRRWCSGELGEVGAGGMRRQREDQVKGGSGAFYMP
jgi:hypothetical protein